MAASAQEAIGSDAQRFAAGYLATRLLLVGLYARAYRHVTEAQPTIRTGAPGHSGGIARLASRGWIAGDSLGTLRWAVPERTTVDSISREGFLGPRRVGVRRQARSRSRPGWSGTAVVPMRKRSRTRCGRRAGRR